MVPNDRKNKNGRIHNKNIIPYIYIHRNTKRLYTYTTTQLSVLYITTIPYQP